MIVITGMHRSGTSAITCLIKEMGVSLGNPSKMLPADQWNRKGYFEKNDIIDLNHKIITGFHRFEKKWQTHLGNLIYSTMPGLDKVKKNAEKLIPEINQLGKKYSGVAVKDPRFCLTLSWWLKWTHISRIVVCLRNPIESVLSLQRRQNFPVKLGFLFWNYHISHLLKTLNKEKPVLFVNYDQLFGNQGIKELERINMFFDLALEVDQMHQILHRAIEKKMKNWTAVDDSQLPQSTRSLWFQLLNYSN